VHRAGVVEGLHPSGGAVDELIRDDERAGPERRQEAADRTRGEDLADAQFAQRPQVRPVRDPVRWMAVIAAVPGQERGPTVADHGHRDRVGGLAERGFHVVLLGPGQERVEPRATDDGNVGSRCDVHPQRLTARGGPG